MHQRASPRDERLAFTLVKDDEKLVTEEDDGDSAAEDEPLGHNIYALLIAEVTKAWEKVFQKNAQTADFFVTAFRLFHSLFLVFSVIGMQVFLLHSVSSKLCVPAVRQVRRVYDEFQVAIYGENTYITINGFHRGKAGAEPDLAGFRALSMEKKVEICSVPLSQPYFTYTILLIWTVTCLAEIRRAVRLLFSTLLSVPTVLVVEDVLKDKTITGMTRGMKAFIGVFCFLPRIAAAVLLNYLGCRWLLSTANLQDLFLNSLALEFMVVLPELLYNTFATDRGKRLTEETMLTAGEKAAAPLKGSIKSLLLSLMWVAFAVVWVYVYMVYVQSVLPGYNWDVRPVCVAHPEIFLEESDL
ncbi:unnamed protein product [Symbiodinium sp. CCMP2456]|nr:unnamed protein product [Symbiodinium sp. CCMP2456]